MTAISTVNFGTISRSPVRHSELGGFTTPYRRPAKASVQVSGEHMRHDRLCEAHFGTDRHRGFPDVHTSQTAVILVVAVGRERVRIEMELKMIFNFIFGRPKKERNRKASALADL